MEDVIEIILTIFFIIVAIGIVVTILVWGIYFFQKNIQCPQYGDSVHLEYKYNFWAGGCFVNYEGQWIRGGNLRAGKLD